jgi:catechol 2,3-dioxygenase-like lactoylglutathione lyase family enzyme
MKNSTFIILGIAISFCFGFTCKTIFMDQPNNNVEIQQWDHNPNLENMKLGAFSISLSVKDINASKQFYENFGFTVLAGDLKKNYLIMKNGNSLIGLFQGMFEGNILTFNPGWDESGINIEKFDDVREIQQQLKDKGIKIVNEVDPKTSGPAGFMVTDPDGNVILIDQHR